MPCVILKCFFISRLSVSSPQLNQWITDNNWKKKNHSKKIHQRYSEQKIGQDVRCIHRRQGSQIEPSIDNCLVKIVCNFNTVACTFDYIHFSLFQSIKDAELAYFLLRHCWLKVKKERKEQMVIVTFHFSLLQFYTGDFIVMRGSSDSGWSLALSIIHKSNTSGTQKQCLNSGPASFISSLCRISWLHHRRSPDDTAEQRR